MTLTADWPDAPYAANQWAVAHVTAPAPVRRPGPMRPATEVADRDPGPRPATPVHPIPITKVANKPRRKPSKSAPRTLGGTHYRVTPRDQNVIEDLARYGMMTTAMAARRHHTSVPAIRQRLAAIERSALIKSGRADQASAKVWAATAAGLSTIGSPLRERHIRLHAMWHTFCLVEIGDFYESRRGETVITEREVRYLATGAQLSSSRMNMPGMRATVAAGLIVPCRGLTAGKVPDMVLARPAHLNVDGSPGRSGAVAIEMELSAKPVKAPGGLEDIIRAYRDATQQYGHVIYFTVRRDRERALNRVIKALHAEARITVSFYAPTEQLGNPARSRG